jgi:hypothetical protein
VPEEEIEISFHRLLLRRERLALPYHLHPQDPLAEVFPLAEDMVEDTEDFNHGVAAAATQLK